jgi:hypothetical protein
MINLQLKALFCGYFRPNVIKKDEEQKSDFQYN